MPIIPPPKEDVVRASVTFKIPRELKADLDAAAAAEAISLNEVAIHFLRFAADAWKEEKAREKKKK